MRAERFPTAARPPGELMGRTTIDELLAQARGRLCRLGPGAAIEGVVRQERIDLDWLAVDTHGYTDAAMCFSRLQSFDLCPQLSNLRERRLTVPKGMEIPKALASVVDATLQLDCIKERWDDLLRISASISNGTTTM